MKKIFSFIKLGLFIISASTLYVYAMKNTVPPKSPSQLKSPNDLTLTQADAIWNAIDKLEDSRYKVGKDSTITVESFGETEKNNLKKLVTGYEYLPGIVTDMINAMDKNNDLDEYFKQKEKIREYLKPIWSERQRQKKIGWYLWIRSNVTQTMNRLYNYFFPSQKTSSANVGTINKETGKIQY
jgi:hypothetical protein